MFKNMKNLILLSLSLFMVFASSAERRVYIELLGQQKNMFSTKVKVKVDFGQETSFWKGNNNQKLVNDEGQDINFNSMVDAMNYMGQFGWKFAQAYVVTSGGQNVYHWLLYKDIDDDSELMEGFMTKELFKSAQAPTEKFQLTYVKKATKASTWDVVKEQTVDVTKEELQQIIDEWKAQSNEKYDYDVRIKKNK